MNAEVNKKNVECVKPESNERNTLNKDQNEVVGNEHRGKWKNVEKRQTGFKRAQNSTWSELTMLELPNEEMKVKLGH